MSSVLRFSPEWLETNFLPTSVENSCGIYKNITLEINNKSTKAVLYNVIDINSIRLCLPSYKKSRTNDTIKLNTKKLNREKRLLDYNMLDDRNYYFTPQDFDHFLNDETFDVDLCNINSPLFKNYIDNTYCNKLSYRFEDYYLYKNPLDQYIIDDEDSISNNYVYENYSDSSNEEFDLN